MKKLLMLSTMFVTVTGAAVAQQSDAAQIAGSGSNNVETQANRDNTKDMVETGETDQDMVITKDGPYTTLAEDGAGVVEHAGPAGVDQAEAGGGSTGEGASADRLTADDLNATPVGEAPAQENALAAEPGVDPADMNRAIAESGAQQQHPMTRENYTAVDTRDLDAGDLSGMRVLDTNDQEVGEISEVVLTDDGSIDSLIVDVGGFLGFFEKSVALASDDLQLMRQDSGTEIVAYTQMSESEIEELPEWQQ